MICHGWVLLIQCWFNHWRVIHKALVITVDMRFRVLLADRNTKHPELEANVLNVFGALLHCGELGWESTCFYCLLLFAYPFHWCSIHKDDVSGMWPSSLLICSMRSINISTSHHHFLLRLGHLIRHELLVTSWLNSPKSMNGKAGSIYNNSFGFLLK